MRIWRRQDENEEWRKRCFGLRRETVKRGRPAVGMRAEAEGSGVWNWGQMRARVGGVKAVNTTVGRHIGSTCSFAETGPKEHANVPKAISLILFSLTNPPRQLSSVDGKRKK